MKRDMKPFVVEVKRGTRRSSFLGQVEQSTSMSEAQRRAEAALFAPVMDEIAARSAPTEPSRRILRSLVEPEPPKAPSVEDDADPYAAQRPRPVGRPRKLRPVELPVVRAVEVKAVVAALPKVTAPVESQKAPTPPLQTSEPSTPSRSATPPVAKTAQRQRLRERSTILARYVLGTEPAPGERWNRSMRRIERRTRSSGE